jgi:four helix bundle protein
MTFGHERLDVYRAAIEYAGWAFRLCEGLKSHRNAKDQLLRASQAIPLNIAEGNGKATQGERRRFFEIARGSALECGAVQDVLEVCGALSPAENADAKKLLDQIVAMLTKLGHRGYSVREATTGYGKDKVKGDSDPDTDSDPDPDRISGQTSCEGTQTRQANTCGAEPRVTVQALPQALQGRIRWAAYSNG